MAFGHESDCSKKGGLLDRGTVSSGGHSTPPLLIVTLDLVLDWHLLCRRSAGNWNGCLSGVGGPQEGPPALRDLLEAPSPQTVQESPPPAAELARPLCCPGLPLQTVVSSLLHPREPGAGDEAPSFPFLLPHPGPPLYMSQQGWGTCLPFLHTRPCFTRSFHKFHQGSPQQCFW